MFVFVFMMYFWRHLVVEFHIAYYLLASFSTVNEAGRYGDWIVDGTGHCLGHIK